MNLREAQKLNRDNDDASYTEKYQEHIASCCGYKSICTDHRLSKSGQTCCSENTSYKFSAKMLREVEYYKEMVRKHFKREIAMDEKDKRNLYV